VKDGIKGDGRQSNQGWRLDYFLVSRSIKEKAISSFVLDEYKGSDHCPIRLIWQV
jgi:exodeoxyribonuclease-3